MTTLYLDMDGVVADFDLYAKQVLNTDNTSHSWPEDDWKKLSNNPRLYRDLQKTPEADRLVRYCRQLCTEKSWDLFFLTAVPRNDDMPWAYYDKILWIQERYPDIPVFFGPHSSTKWKHCKTGDVLVDDRPSNCEDWNQKGNGIAILHKGDVIETINRLSKL